MTRCPICGSLKVTLVLSDDPRAECERCHATWIQDGASQREIRGGRVEQKRFPRRGKK